MHVRRIQIFLFKIEFNAELHTEVILAKVILHTIETPHLLDVLNRIDTFTRDILVL